MGATLAGKLVNPFAYQLSKSVRLMRRFSSTGSGVVGTAVPVAVVLFFSVDEARRWTTGWGGALGGLPLR